MKPVLFLSLVLVLLVAGCAMSVSELNADKEKYVGEKITVAGVVKNTVKIGSLSGYTLRDPKTDETVAVSAQKLPSEGKDVTVSGTWSKDTLFGYYLKADG